MRPDRPRRFTALLPGLLASAAVAASPSVIHRTSAAEPPTLDPTLGSATVAAPILSDLVEGLVARTPAREPSPGAAESWRVSPDGLEWTFRLRGNLQWSDGTPLRAEDFVWSFRRLLSPETAAGSAGLYFMIANARQVVKGEAAADTLGVSAPDPHTVRFRLEHPAPYFLQLLANTQAVPVPRHVIEKSGREWTHPGTFVGNGPYVLVERVPQTYTRLVRNPRYREADQVHIDQVYWHATPDMGAAFRRYRAGELDMVLNLTADDLAWARSHQPATLHTAPMHATWQLLFNLRRPPFDDVRVRRALSLAIDRDLIAGRVLQGTVRTAGSWISPGIGGYPGVENPDASLTPAVRRAQARKLLAQAGYSPDRPLTVPLIYDSSEENRRILVAVASMWHDIGVVTELQNLEFRAVLGRLRSGDFALIRASTFSLYDDPFAYLQQMGSGATSNWGGYANPAYDDLLLRANSAAGAAGRMPLFVRAERLLLKDQPLIPVYHYQAKLLVAPRVKGWWDAPIGTPPSRYLSLTD